MSKDENMTKRQQIERIHRREHCPAYVIRDFQMACEVDMQRERDRAAAKAWPSFLASSVFGSLILMLKRSES